MVNKKIIASGVILLILTALVASFNYLVNFPNTHPEKTLELSEKVERFINRITLPIKIAKISSQPPDQQLLMPVYGVRVAEVTDTWGAPRPDNRLHEGQDIFAPKGTPVFSATRGYVVRITDRTLGGNSVFIVGPGGRVYFYTHLDRYADDLNVGDEVTTDTVIGYVGNTGNASNTPPHLHFEVRNANKPINPLPLLVDRF